jgi:glycerate 2-kinase
MTIPELRQCAQQIWEAALTAARPEACIPKVIQLSDDGFVVDGKEIQTPGRLVVIGAGKASAGMAGVIEGLFGKRISAGLVITKYGHRIETEHIQIFEAGHPVPDQSGALAVEGMREILRDLRPGDVVLCLISGGGSALLPAPAPQIDLKEKQEVTTALLRAGATIRELNAVRKHLSSIKGGQLLRWTAPARVVSLIMSDVIGDPLDFIASGPTSPDTTTFADALTIIQKYGIEVSGRVRERFEAGTRGEIEETPKEGDPIFERVSNHVIATNRMLVETASAKARELGFETLFLSSEVEGEARDVGRFFASMAREIGSTGNPAEPPACVLAAGETTVTVRGLGMGGRNQEMALAWAMKMKDWDRPTCFASIATDGTDGSTIAAGGLVDPHTYRRAIEVNMDPARYLRSNDSYNFLKAVGDLVTTGPTQTNLMDLQILLAG